MRVSVPSLPRAGWLALGAIAAALLVDGGPVALPLPGGAAAIVAVVAFVIALAVAATGRGGPAALLVGFGSVGLRAAAPLLLAGAAAVPLALPAGSGSWEGQVVDVSSPSGAEQRAMLRLWFPGREGSRGSATGADSSGAGAGSGWLVYAWLPRHPAVVPGDAVAVRGTLSPPPEDAPGFAGFLGSRGAVGTLKGHALELLAAGRGPLAAVEQSRWAIDGWLGRAMPAPEAGLAAGILIGLRERVDRSVADDFTTTGLTHVVAISGWNIALVAGIATALLRATGLGRRPRSAIVVAAIVAYTVLAGAEASVIRAAVMGGVVIVAREGGRPSGAAAALGIACWGLLLAEPRMIDDIGLQLSLAATAGLLTLGGRAEAAVRRVTGDRAPRWFSETLGVSLAAQLSTLPLILLHFGRLSLISPVANLLVAPVVPLAMLGAAVAVLVGPLVGALPGALLALPLLACWLPLALMTRGAGLLADVPLASVELAAPFDLVGAGVAWLALALALRAARPRRSRGGHELGTRDHATAPGAAGSGPATRVRTRRVAVAAVTLVVVAGGTVVLVARPLPTLQVSVLDVGQGDAILLEASDGSRVLVDGGPDPDLLVRRLDERIPLWDRHIDVAILTHPHEDHAGGLAGLAPRYAVSRVAETGMPSSGAGTRQLRAAAARHGSHRVRLAQGDRFAIGAARVEVLWPPRAAIPDHELSDGRAVNGTSIVLAVHLGQQRLLLTGDLEDDHDADILAALPADGRPWDLLKVSHHGGATATSLPLLERLRPRLAAISSGTGNRYGHPSPATLERLAKVRAHVWRTDQQGTLSLALDGRARDATALPEGPTPVGVCPPAAGRPPTVAAGGRLACYARPDGGTHTVRSALAAHVHVATAATAASRHGRGRGRSLPRPPCQRRRPRCRPAPGRDCRAPPRRRQVPAARPSPAGPRSWSRWGRLAERGRAPRAGARAHRPPRLAAG